MLPPDTPYQFTTHLLPTGALSLQWKCNQPAGARGTTYEVRRAADAGLEALNAVGSTGRKSFPDETEPARSATVLYEIAAVRSTQRGTPALFTVYFGVGNSGQRTVSFREGTPLDATFNVEVPPPRKSRTVKA